MGIQGLNEMAGKMTADAIGSEIEKGARSQDRFSQSGFTLLEVMVALAIMAIVIGSIMRLQSQSVSLQYTAKFESHAPFLAQRKLSEVTQSNPTEAVTEQGDFGEDFQDYAWEIMVAPIESEALGQALAGFQEINITIKHKSESLEYSIKSFRLAH